MTQSTGSVISNTGKMLVKVKNSSNATIASSVFNWYNSSSTLYPSNPTSINTWVNANWQTQYDLEIEFAGIETTGNAGNNSFVMYFNYGSNSVGSSASSFVNNGNTGYWEEQ